MGKPKTVCAHHDPSVQDAVAPYDTAFAHAHVGFEPGALTDHGATLDHTASAGLVIRNPNKPAAPEVPVIEGLVRDDELSAEVEMVVTAEVNPALASHGGFVTYVGHDGEGTAYLTMGGGCHGCSMSRMTMLDGVQTMLVEQVAGIERVRDLTDHASGENPFYR